MVMYLGTFAVSFGLALYGDSLRKKKNMRGFALCMILAVLAFLMAMRGKYLWYAVLTVLACGFHNSAVLSVGFLALLVVIWLYQVVLKGNDGIYPYASRILHIGRETLI